MMHPAEQYAADVRSGKIPACKYIRQAVERYYNDLDNAVESGWLFSRQKAERAIRFIEKLPHTKGKWAGTPLHLEPWQMFLVWQLEGWLMAATGKRRFTEAYVQIPRKNGKTALAAAISLLHGYADKELGAETYYAATQRDQARICFEMAKKMVERSDLSKRSVVTRDAFTYEALGTTHRPVSSEAGNIEGTSPSCGIVDEYHMHKTDEVLDSIATGMGAREQPLLFIITTAGTSTSSPCFRHYKVMTQVLDGVLSADRTLIMIYTLDDKDEVKDPEMWVKANPNYGVSVDKEWLANQVEKMHRDTSKVAPVLTKNFNIWMDAPTVWISAEQWDSNRSEIAQESLLGRKCYAALDLASTSDYCSFVKLFNEGGRYQMLWRFYIPEDKFKDRYDMQREHADIDAWVRQGWLTITPGNVTDYDYILADVARDMEDYDIEAIAYDPWNSAQVAAKLTERGANMQAFSQTIGNYAYPTKEFSRIVLKGIVDHYDNPVARWMLSNVVIRTDANGNERPDKAKSAEKIDGIVAAIMALGQYLSDKGDTESVYEGRGLLGYDDEEDNNQGNENRYEYNYDDDDY